MRTTTVLAGMLAVAAVAAAEERRAFEISDWYRSAIVGAPVAAPAGGRVVFDVTRYDLGGGATWSELWVAGTDGGELRQMTFGRHHDASPVFSADGRSLFFVSDRGGEAQVWVMAVDGGEARQLTRVPGGVADPLVSPDGRWLAVTAEVYPECGADDECNRTIADSSAGGPLSVRVADALPYRHWSSWLDGRVQHLLLVDATSGEVVRDLTPGRWDSPPRSASGAAAAFSPDGRRLVFVSNHDPEPARSTNADLWLVELDLETPPRPPLNLTAGNPGFDGDPAFSPDGRRLAFLSQATPGYESDLTRLAVLDLASGAVRYLTDRDRFDDWVSGHRWLPGGEGLLFQAERRGVKPLFHVELAGGSIEERHVHGALAGWDLTGDGAAVVYTRSTVGEPPEVFTVAVDGGAARQLTRFNRQLEAEVDLRPAEQMWVESSSGDRLQVFVVKPHGFDPAKKYPLILNVHGGPQMQWTDRWRGDWQVYPGKGYVVAFPNPTGSAGFGQDFVDAIACDWGGRVYRDVLDVSRALAALPWVDGDRMGAMGWSWGGYMMMWLEGHEHPFKALASMMGVYDLRSMYGATEELWFVEHDMCGLPSGSDDYRRWSPSEHAERFATPCLVITGEQDFRVPYTQSLQFFTDLQVRGVPSRLVVFPKAGHWPSWYEMAFYYLAHLDWFHQWLGGEPPTWDPGRFARNQEPGVAISTTD